MTPLARIRHVLLDGDISLAVLIAGFGLILWAAFGVFMFAEDLAAYSAMFPLGNGWFWVSNYVFCGVAMWVLVAYELPAISSMIIGMWVCTIWTWAALARMVAVATYQTGNATSIVYIVIGLLIIHRSARNGR